MNFIYDINKCAQKARETIAEGVVLLENKNHVLPLKKGTKVALFGRSQFNYYKSGTGSGGMVNTAYVTGIREAILQQEAYVLNQRLTDAYAEWLKDHPFDEGVGWAAEPWFQEEMVLNQDFVEELAEESEAAIIILGRTAGEDKDNKAEKGSYYLMDEERDLFQKVCKSFQKTIVLLNVGNIIDMNWVNEYHPSAVMYIWQGGQEGGNGVVDVLLGNVSPSGKLADTIAYDIEDYPSTKNFGDEKQNIYQEDIYVGYRYFETFAKERVQYPFGYGMTYSSFEIDSEDLCLDMENKYVQVTGIVKNTGDMDGKEVVQVYCNAPQGVLGKPLRSLCSYTKTSILKCGMTEEFSMQIPLYHLASYDDSGKTGHKSCYVLEPGNYEFYIGSDVRSAVLAGTIHIEKLLVLEELQESMAPIQSFERMVPQISRDGDVQLSMECVPLRTIHPLDRRNANLPKELEYTGDKGYKLIDVENANVNMEQFIAQLSDEDLCCIFRGEGMCSPKVTPGTAGAFGGVTEELLHFGIPLACCADGPAGIRMDCGTEAFAMPNGACLASTFNDALIQELYQWEGLELRKNHIDTLLGPGMNIHRSPLNGRNFEYFSEDPLLTGKMAAAQLRGMHMYGVTGTIKHFAANNQELKRREVEAIVSERALREIYLRGFEIAVKEGNAISIMTMYGPINGFWTASNYDLLTTVLRKEWKYKGIVMTDWWGEGNEDGKPGSVKEVPAMARCQNDLFMVVPDAKKDIELMSNGLKKTTVTRGELQRNAANICRYLMTTPAYRRLNHQTDAIDEQLRQNLSEKAMVLSEIKKIQIVGDGEISAADFDTAKGKSSIFEVTVGVRGIYQLEMTVRANTKQELAQIPLMIFQDGSMIKTITLKGSDQEWLTETVDITLGLSITCYLKFHFGQAGMEIKQCKLVLKESFEE